MNTAILDTIIGLILIYMFISLLVTAIQEVIVGAGMRNRVGILHQLVNEAVGRDAELKARLLKNPLVFALYREEEAKPSTVRKSGPSAIPPEIFARALLMELDTKGKHVHPAERYATPQAFFDAQTPAENGAQEEILQALRGLAVGHEADWIGFETAIAGWFQHIGDRSEGWFKRSSTVSSLVIGLFIAAILNIDSLHIAQVLSTDASVRGGLVAMAQLVVAERATEDTEAPDQALETSPEVLVSARLMDAYNRLRPIYFRDRDIAAYTHGLQKVESVCKHVVEIPPEEQNQGARAAVAQTDNAPVKDRPRAKEVNDRFVSDAKTWLDLIPALLARIELALANNVQDTNRMGSPNPPPNSRHSDPALESLQDAQRCLTYVSAWVRAATTASQDPAVQTTMQDAAVAIEDSKWALDRLLHARRAPLPLVRLFQAAPRAYADCVEDATDIGALRRCITRSMGELARFPVGWMNGNQRMRFCDVIKGKAGESLNDLPKTETFLCSGSAEARPALGLPALRMSLLQSWPFALLEWALGILITTFAVALGAPFWFELLSKLVRVRSAGRTREMDDNALKGKGTLPRAVFPSEEGHGATRASGPAPELPSPFSSAQNAYEQRLTRREIVALQQRIGITPASGEWDETTRLKLREALRDAGLSADGTLTPATYTALVGRPPVATHVVTGIAGARPRRGAPYAAAPALAKRLMTILDFPNRIPDNVDRFTDDLRALTVLYRFKSETGKTLAESRVSTLARDNPAALDELDEVLLNEILTSVKTFGRDAAAPWMDWAIGELGQKENGASTRASSNPRICEYLDSKPIALGDSGDKTPWCAAFVHWVLTHQFGKALTPPATPGLAKSWLGWGAPRTSPHGKPAPEYGDVLIFELGASASSPDHHVGFCVAVDGNKVWVLGGNQGSDRVKLSTFRCDKLLGARHPI